MNDLDRPSVKFCPFCAEEILAMAIKCKHCGERVDKEAIAARDGSSITRMGGLFLFLTGLAGFCYFWQFFDPSVEVPKQTIMGITIGGQRVNNLGLMHDQNNWMMGSAFVTVLGAAIMYMGRKRK
jgi:hypothetical protein